MPSEMGKKRRVGAEDFFGGVGLADGFHLDLVRGAKRVKSGGKDPEEILGAKWERKKKKKGVFYGEKKKMKVEEVLCCIFTAVIHPPFASCPLISIVRSELWTRFHLLHDLLSPPAWSLYIIVEP